MAMRNDTDDYEWALTRKSRSSGDDSRRLHDYAEPAPDAREVTFELMMTLVGIGGVFLLLIALVKVFS